MGNVQGGVEKIMAVSGKSLSLWEKEYPSLA